MSALGRCVFKTGLLLWLVAASSSCARANKPLQETTEASFPFGSADTLTVEHTDGSIHVYGWKEPRIKLVALRQAYTAARLQQIKVAADRQPTSLTIRTHISTASGILADRSGTVDYTIIVPEAARLEKLSLANGEIVLEGLRGGKVDAEVVNGKITAINCFAALRGRAVNGAMEVFFDWWEDLTARYDFVIRRGRIVAKLPRRARFSVDAQTAGGNITDQFGWRAERVKRAGKTMLRAATAGDAPVSLQLRSSGGNISIDLMR